MSTVTAFAPATVANVGPGFDVFGFALAGVGDTVEVRRRARPGARLVGVVGDGGRLPREAAKNVASAVVMKMLKAVDARFGVEVTLRKGLPLGSGLGSSAASAVAAAVASNGLLGGRFSDEELLEFSRYGEKVACGAAHADNVASALLGGFTIVRSYEPLEVVRLTVPDRWHAAVVHPHFDLPTKKARSALPGRVPLAALTANVGNAAALVAAIAKRDCALFGRCLMGDAVVEPARAGLIPGYAEVRRAALAAGAAGVAISGAGPSLVALTNGRRVADMVGRKMAAVWQERGIGADIHVSRVGAPGARILTEE